MMTRKLIYCFRILRNRLIVSLKKKFSNSEILTIMEGLNKHFKYMHNNGIIHRDLNPENIMIKYVDSSKTNYITKKLEIMEFQKNLIMERHPQF